MHFSRDVRLYLTANALFGFVLFGGIYPLLYNLYLLRLGYNTEFVGLANATGGTVFCPVQFAQRNAGGTLGQSVYDGCWDLRVFGGFWIAFAGGVDFCW